MKQACEIHSLQGRIIALVFILALSFFRSSFAETSPAPQSLTKLSVRWNIPEIVPGYTPFYVAIDKGFYAEEGLEIDMRPGSEQLNPVKMVAAGQDDFGVPGAPDALLIARSKGAPLKAVAVLYPNANFIVLLTLKASGITKVEQLEGKKVGFIYGHPSESVLHALFKKTNTTVEEVNVGLDYKQLVTGKVAACWAFRTMAGMDLPAKGVPVNEINPKDYGIITQGHTIFTTESMIQNHPDKVKKFLSATFKGLRYTVDHPEQAIDSILKRIPSADRDLTLKKQLIYTEIIDHARSQNRPLGYMDAQMFTTIYNQLHDANLIKKDFNPAEVFDCRFVEEISRDQNQ